jgi:hypothetical protein
VIKEYCDSCGVEIDNNNRADGGKIHCPDSRLGCEVPSKKRGGPVLRVEIITSSNGTANAGHFCKHCILDALNALDDRKKPRLRAV